MTTVDQSPNLRRERWSVKKCTCAKTKCRKYICKNEEHVFFENGTFWDYHRSGRPKPNPRQHAEIKQRGGLRTAPLTTIPPLSRELSREEPRCGQLRLLLRPRGRLRRQACQRRAHSYPQHPRRRGRGGGAVDAIVAKSSGAHPHTAGVYGAEHRLGG